MTELLHTAFDTVLIILMALSAVMIVIFTVAIIRAAWQTITAKKPVPNMVVDAGAMHEAAKKVAKKAVKKTVKKTTK